MSLKDSISQTIRNKSIKDNSLDEVKSSAATNPAERDVEWNVDVSSDDVISTLDNLMDDNMSQNNRMLDKRKESSTSNQLPLFLSQRNIVKKLQ